MSWDTGSWSEILAPTWWAEVVTFRELEERLIAVFGKRDVPGLRRGAWMDEKVLRSTDARRPMEN